MGRQRNIHSEKHLKRLRKSHADRHKGKPIGFYKKGGKTRPITKKKTRKTRVVKRVLPRRKGRYFYEFEDHAYETQEQARNVLENVCPPGKHQWLKVSPDSKMCSECGLTQVDRKAIFAFVKAGLDPEPQDLPAFQIQRPSEPYDARWRNWITGLITKAGEDPHLVEIQIHSDGVDIIPKWAPGSVFDHENMKKYEDTMALIKAPWNAAAARWELRDLIPIWVNPQDGYWETDAAPRGAKAFYVTGEELHRHNQRNSNDIYEDAIRG